MADLSIIIPMYNNCKNVAQTLHKLYIQAQDVKIDLQVIVINDGSSESVVDVKRKCKQYGFEYYSQANAGGAATCNRGLEKAKGEYFTFIDADDSITDGYVAIMAEEIKSGAEFITNKWLTLDWRVGETFPMPLPNHNVWANVYKSHYYKGVQFDEKRQVAWDWDWLQRASEANASPITLHTNYLTNIYNDINPDSITNKYSRGEIGEWR